jgi:hypothetical protein
MTPRVVLDVLVGARVPPAALATEQAFQDQLTARRRWLGSVTCQIWFCREASESAADAVANVRRKRGVDHLDRL